MLLTFHIESDESCSLHLLSQWHLLYDVVTIGQVLEISLGDVRVYWGWGGKMSAGKSTRPLLMVAK